MLCVCVCVCVSLQMGRAVPTVAELESLVVPLTKQDERSLVRAHKEAMRGPVTKGRTVKAIEVADAFLGSTRGDGRRKK